MMHDCHISPPSLNNVFPVLVTRQPSPLGPELAFCGQGVLFQVQLQLTAEHDGSTGVDFDR